MFSLILIFILNLNQSESIQFFSHSILNKDKQTKHRAIMQTNKLSELIYIGKDSQIGRVLRQIQSTLEITKQVELRCTGTASQKGILIAQACIAEGFAKYTRFTTQTILHNGKQIICTIIKLKENKKNKGKIDADREPKRPKQNNYSQNNYERRENNQRVESRKNNDSDQFRRNEREGGQYRDERNPVRQNRGNDRNTNNRDYR